jgi:hypothetical protein
MRKTVVSIAGFCCLLVWLLAGCSGPTVSPGEGKYRSQDIPVNVTATDTLTNDRVVIAWDSVPGARCYLIYRAPGLVDSFFLISPEVPGLNYLDSTIIPESTYFYRVRSVLQTGDTSMPSTSDMGRAIRNQAIYVPAFSASDGSFSDRVSLSWRKPLGGIGIIVSRSDSASSWAAICSTAVDTTCMDSLVTPGPHRYRLAVVNESRGTSEYFFDNGYRTVTDLDFFIEANKTVRHSQSKLTKLGSLGSEQAQGDTTGSVTYNAVMNGLSSVNISIDYVDYRDYYLTLNGRQYTVITNIFTQSGTVTDTVFVTGIYPGAIVYNVNVDGGKPKSGTYTVIQQGRSPADIQYADVAQYVQ